MLSTKAALANVFFHISFFVEAIPQLDNGSCFALVQVQATVLPHQNHVHVGHHAHSSAHREKHGHSEIHNQTRHAATSSSIDVERKPWWQVVALARPVPYQHHFKFIDFVQRLQRKRSAGHSARPLATPRAAAEALMAEPVTDKDQIEIELYHSNGMMTVGQWQCCFVISLILLALVTRLIADKLPVAEPELIQFELERGRHCWNYCCGVLFFMLLMITFWMTLLQVGLLNDDIRKNPNVAEATASGGNVTVIRHVIQDPGQRAFEAGDGVAFSVVIACITCFTWRYYSEVRITSALLAQFIMRGGTVAVFVALVLEIVGSVVLGLVGMGAPLFQMTIVGFSEEGSKMIATVCGAWIIGSRMEEAAPGCCSRCWRILVEYPRALMLAGLAVGYGFMIVENCEYLVQAASTPGETREYPGDQADETLDGSAMNFFTGVTIAIRVLLNIHPWLAGITAGRIATVAFKEHRDTAMLSACELLWAVWPSAVAHAAYDLIIVTVPLLGLISPPLFWFFARRSFYNMWEEAEKDADALNPPGGSSKTGF